MRTISNCIPICVSEFRPFFTGFFFLSIFAFFRFEKYTKGRTMAFFSVAFVFVPRALPMAFANFCDILEIVTNFLLIGDGYVSV